MYIDDKELEALRKENEDLRETHSVTRCADAVTLITPDTPIEVVANLLYQLEGMAERIREARAELEARMIQRIKEHGEFSIGDIRYYVGTPKRITCRSYEETLNRLLEITGGDVGRLCGCLSSGAFKHGTVKRLLDELAAPPETFDQLFETAYDEELKEGKLQKADRRFAK